LSIHNWLLPNGKDRDFWFTKAWKRKNHIQNVEEQKVLLFSKKMKKTLAHNKISCTFAAAFGNE